jgi:hypothetical protein
MFLALGLAIVLGFLFRWPILRFMGTIPIARDELRPAQLMTVASGAPPEIRHGLDFYEQGLGEKVFFLGLFPVELVMWRPAGKLLALIMHPSVNTTL